MDHSVELYIDELVLHGFLPHDRYHIGSAVEAELTRLFTQEGIPPSLSTGREIDSMNAGGFNLQPGNSGKTTGTNIANSVYKALAE